MFEGSEIRRICLTSLTFCLIIITMSDYNYTPPIPSTLPDNFSTDGGSTGLTEEEVNELIDAKLSDLPALIQQKIDAAAKPVRLDTPPWDTSTGITARADSIGVFRSGNIVTLSINALEITNTSGEIVSGSNRILKGLPRPVARIYGQLTNQKDYSNLKPGYVCIDENGFLTADSGFKEVGDRSWLSVTYITKD